MKCKYKWLMILSALLLSLLGAGTLLYSGTISLSRTAAEQYEVRGIDVSHYQGEIDFSRLSEQNIRFAFIKATEGSTYVDERFPENLASVQASPLRYGFYHFFSYDSAGKAQAEHFINTVPNLQGMLPPVIDVEFYGNYFSKPASAEDVIPQLRDMVEALRTHYGMDPILYCTQRAYRLYIRDHFEDCDLWIRDVWLIPADGWTFWQYTDQAVLDGYSGDVRCIDVNVFSGSAEDFSAYPDH